MAQVENKSNEAIKSQCEVHKDSGLAVGEAKWYIAECKPTRERTLRTMLQKAGYEAYVASQMEMRVYKSRNRRKVEHVLIPGRVFVRTEEDKLIPLMQQFSCLYRFHLDRAGLSNKYGRSPFAFVPENQMQQLKYVLGQARNPVFFTADELFLDQKVRVMRGPLAGIDGWFYQKASSSYIVLKIEMGNMGNSNYVYTEIPIEDVQLRG